MVFINNHLEVVSFKQDFYESQLHFLSKGSSQDPYMC